jgi:chromosome segregation ATPase
MLNDNQEITTRKEELEKILRSFNIYVDNPCCILTQEESKKFVNGAEGAKYDFFLRATGLYYLREDLVKVDSELEETLKVKNMEESKLGEKKKNVDDLEQKIELFKALDAKELEIKILSAKIFWREVSDANSAVKRVETEKNQAEADCERAQLEYDRVIGSQNDYTADLEELNQGLTEISDRKSTIEQEIAAKNLAITEATRNFNLIKRDLDEQKSAKSGYEVRLRNVTQEVRGRNILPFLLICTHAIAPIDCYFARTTTSDCQCRRKREN